MKKLVIFCAVMLCLVACHPAQTKKDTLKDLVENVEKNSDKFTEADWELSDAKYESILQAMEEYDYSNEELREIGRLKARYVKEVGKNKMRIFKKNLNNLFQQSMGVMDELKEYQPEVEAYVEDLEGMIDSMEVDDIEDVDDIEEVFSSLESLLEEMGTIIEE